MKESKVCPKCGSREVMTNVRVVDSWGGNPMVAVCEKPHAMFFKGTHRGNLSAWICGQCGFTELYVNNPDDLRRVFNQQRTV